MKHILNKLAEVKTGSGISFMKSCLRSQLLRSMLLFTIALPIMAANTFVATGGTVTSGYWNSTNTGALASFDVPNDVAIRNATVQVSVNGADYEVVGNLFPIAAVGVADSRSFTSTQIESITGFAEGAQLTFKIVYLLSNFTASGHESALSPATVVVYDNPPDVGTTGAVETTGGTVVSNYWNPTNTGVNVTTPIPNDNALQGGSLQIQAYGSGSGTWVDVGSSSTISSISSNKTISISSGDITSLAGYGDGNTLYFRSVVTDIAGNPSVSYNQSATTLEVDLTAPAVVNTGTVTTTGDNIIAGYWNSTNDDVLVSVTVPAGDGTLIGGNIQIQGKIGSGSYSNIGNPQSIASTGSKTVTITRSQFDDLPFGTSDVISFRAVITDRAGNSTNGNASGTTLTINEERPTISSIASATDDSAIKGVGDDIVIDVTLSKNVTLSGGNIIVTLETGTTDRTATYSAALSNANTFQVTYTVQNGDESSDLNVKSVALSGGSLVDAFGNDTDFSLPVSNLANNNSFVIDAIGPSIDQITSTTADGYYGVDDVITLQIHFSENVSMASGTLEIELETNTTPDRTISVPATEINNTSIVTATYTVQAGESNSDLTVNSVSESGGTLVDQVGTGADLSLPVSNLASNKNLVIDTTYPSAVQVGSVTTTGGVVVAGKWNESNTNLNVVLSIPNDATLAGGSAQVLAKVGANAFVNIGSASSISATSVNKTISISATDFENDLTIADGNIISFTADVSDRAGNTTRWTTSATTLTVDQTDPTITSITSSPDVTVLEEGESATITVTFSEDVTLSGGSMSLHLNTGTNRTVTATAATANTFSATYTVLAGEQTTDLNVDWISITGSLRDAAGNDASLDIPGDSELRDNSDLEVDAVAPTIEQIYSGSGNGSFGLGRTVLITVQFNEPVTLSGGNLEIVLETGQTNRTVTISPFASSQTVSAIYTVQTGDNSTDLEVLSVSLAGSATLRDARNNDADLTIPATENLDDNSDVVIETTAPIAFTVGTVTPTGAPVVAGYWNANNSGLSVVVPIDNDVTLVGGNIQLRGRVASNAYTNLGDATNIPNAGVNQTISLTEEQFEALNFTDGVTITISAIMTDNAGNQTTGTASASQIIIDQTAPTISSITSSPVEDELELGASADITVTFSEAVTLSGGNIQTTLETGTTDRTITTNSHSNSDNYTITYTTQAGDINTDLNVQSIALSAGTLRDPAGNNTDLTLPVGNNLADNSELNADGVVPAAFTVGSITSAGGTVVANYWNSTNTSLVVSVPIADDASLVGGSIQLQALLSGGVYQNLGSTVTIANKNVTQDVSISNAVLEDLTGFANNKTLTIKATLTDLVGNSTEGSASATVLTIDQSIPTISTITSTPASGNFTIDDVISVVLTFSEAVSLSGSGSLVTTLATGGDGTELTTSSFSNSTTVDEDYTVAAGDEATDLNVSSVALASGTLRDAAGNDVDLSLPTGENLANNSDINIDGIIPSITSITSADIDGYYGVGDQISIEVVFNEALTMTGGDFILTLETGTTDRTINFGQFTEQTSVTGTYTVQTGDNSSDLTAKSLTLSGGTLRDGSAYDANLSLPTGNNLADGHAFVIDGIAPVAFTVGSIVTTGGTVISAYWNSTNTAVLVTVPIANDASLVNGEVQIVGKALIGNSYENLGSAVAISASGTTQNVSISSEALEALADFDDGVSLYISAILTDVADNATTGTASATLLSVDQTAPTISEITSSPVNDSLALGETAAVTITFSENVSLSGDPLVTTFETGDADRSYNTATLLNSDSYSVTYTVQAGDQSNDLAVLSLVVPGTLRDAAGNDADLTINAGNTLSGNSTLVVDGNAPAAFTVGNIVTVGGTVVANYWNSTNTSIRVTVPIDSDESLQNGDIQLQAKIGSNAYETLGNSVSIPNSGTTQNISISAADVEGISGFSDEGVITFRAIITDAVGNSTTGIASATTLHIDQTAATISSITSDPIPGNLGVGESADITVTFSEAVTLSGGSLVTTLETGTTDATLTTAAIAAATSITETYTVSEDEVSSDLTVSSITLTSGSLRDAAGNASDLTLPVGNNLADNSALVVDGVIPTLVSITSTSDDSQNYSQGDEIDLVVTFSKAVTLAGGNFQLTLETGTVDQVQTISTISNSSTATVTYTVQDGDVSSDLSVVSATLSAGTLQDAAGNDVQLTIPASGNLDDAYDFVVDGTPPADFTVGTVVATGGTVVTDYYNGTNTGMRVTVPIANDQSLQNGYLQIRARAGANAFENIGAASEILTVNANKNISLTNTQVIAITGYDEDVTLTFSAVITDLVGNSTTGTASANVLTVDRVNPTISSITSNPGTDQLSIGESADITITFSEALTLAGGNLVTTLETGTVDASLTTSSISGASSITETYTVSEDEVSSDLTVSSIALSSGSLRDAAGNALDLTLPVGNNLADNSALLVDGVIPTVVRITSTSDDSQYYGQGETITFSVDFSEPVILAGGSVDFYLDGATLIQGVGGVTNDTTLIVNYTVADGDASDDLSIQTPISLSAGATLKDPAGNDVDLSIPAGVNLDANYTFVVDGTAPDAFTVGTVVATGGTVVTDYYNGTNTGIRVTVPIANDASLQGGSVQVRARVGANAFEDVGASSEILAVNANKNISLLDAAILGITGYDEDLVLTFTAVITDSVGNSTTGTASGNLLTIDRVDPVINSITSVPATDQLSIGESVDVTISFSENVTLAGGNLITTLETGDTDAQITRTSLSNAASYTETYTVAEDEVSGDLTVSLIALSSGSLRDAAGNASDLTLPVGNNLADNSALLVDGVIPTIVSITSSSDDSQTYGQGDEIELTVTFSEPVTLSGGNFQLTLETGTLDKVQTIGVINNTTTASVTYTVENGDASDDLSVISASLSAGSITDPSGNSVDMTIPAGGNLDDTYDFVVDGTVPEDFSVGTVIATGGTVVSDYYNRNNTGVRVTVPIADDASLQDGEVQIQARVGSNAFENVGSPSVISAINTNKNIDLINDDIIGITGYDEDLTLSFTAVISDIVGNSTTGTASANLLTIDRIDPVINSITAVPSTDALGIGESTDITIAFSEAVTLAGGTLITTLDTDAELTTSVINAVNSITETYTVAADEVSSDLTVNSIALSAGTLRDAAGNATDLSLPGGNNLGDNSALVVDGIIPTLSNISSSLTSDSLGLGSTVTIDLEFSEAVILTGGDLQLTLETGDVDRVLTISGINNTNTVSTTYTVLVGDSSDDLSVNDIILTGGTLKDPSGNDVDYSIPAGYNLDDNNDILVDGILPADFQTGNITTLGAPVVEDYWNLLNTDIQVVIPVTGNDGSLDGGTAHLEARVDANAFTSIGDAVAVGTNPVTISIDRATLEADLPGYYVGTSLEVRGVLTDIAGNETTGASSANTLTLDLVAPASSVVGSITAQGGTNIVAGYMNAGNTSILVSTPIANDASMLNGRIQLQADIDGLNSWVNVGQDSTVTTINAIHTITLLQADLNLIGADDGETLTFRAVLTDIAGNVTTGTQGVNSLIIDTTAPAIVTVDDPVAVGAPIVANYFNISNSGLDVSIPIEPDNTLIGGSIQFRSYIDGVQQATYGEQEIIDFTPLIILIPRASLESMPDYADGVEITFDALITDAAGNETTATMNVTPVVVDQTAPVANAFDIVLPQTGVVVEGYWNGDNESLLITVPLDDSDISLIGGTLQASADIVPGNGIFETFATTQNINALTSTLSITIPAAELEALEGGVGFVDGLDIHFKTIITDDAGNSTTSVSSAVTLEIDQTAPAVPIITDIEIKGENAIENFWNSAADSMLLAFAVNFAADPSLDGGFYQLLASVGDVYNENPYSAVIPDSFPLPVPAGQDTLRFGRSTILGVPNFQDQKYLYTRVYIQDRAGNGLTTVPSLDSVYIDISPPEDFDTGVLTATGGTVVENAFNNSNTGIDVTIPIANDTSLLNGKAIIKVSLSDLGPPLIQDTFTDIDTVTITSIDTDLHMTLDLATLTTLPNWSQNRLMNVTAGLLDYAGNQVVGTQSQNALSIDLMGPQLPTLNDTTTVGGFIVAHYWNGSNSGIRLGVNTPVDVDTSLIGGYFQVQGLVGIGTFSALGDPVNITSPNFTSLTVNIDSSDIEHLAGFGENLPLHVRLLMVDARGNDTFGVRMDTLFWIDQVEPVIGNFIEANTTTDPFINDEDTLKAAWENFSDSNTGINYYEYSIGNAPDATNVSPWTSVPDTTHFADLLTYVHNAEYVINVRAIDVAGNVSATLSSDVITADLVVPQSTSAASTYYFIDDWEDTDSFGGTYSDDLSGVDSLWMSLKRSTDGYYWNDTQWVSDSLTLVMPFADGLWSYSIVADSLENRADYAIWLMTQDSAGNRQSMATLDTFQFVINTAPQFDMGLALVDSSDEDSLYSVYLIAEDPDLTSISGDTLFFSLGATTPAGVLIDSLSGEMTWVPDDSAVGVHTFKAYVRDLYGEQDSLDIQLEVLEVNDAPEPVTLLFPTDSTQLVPEDSLLLTFAWSEAFDIEDNPVTYTITMLGDGYDTTISVSDTFLTVDVSVMDYPSTIMEWFVRALDQEDTSEVSDSYHFTTSAAYAALNTDSLNIDVQRYTIKDTTFSISNLGLTDLRWSLVQAPAWVTFPEVSGTVAFQDSDVVALSVDMADFTVGHYNAAFRIATNDPQQDTITVDIHLGVYEIPNPVIGFYKNAAYPAFYEMMIVDSLGQIDSLKLHYLGESLEITEIDTFSYLATIEVESAGLQSFELIASNWVGDTTITTNVNVSLARPGHDWIASSPDDRFQIKGTSRSMRRSSQIAVLDSVLSMSDDARYKVLSDGLVLAEPVLVSMPADGVDQAIYRRDVSGEYRELPSISDGEIVSAWSEQLGAYKLGPRTLIIPERSQLAQNYPNPFNPSTTLEFDIGFMDGLDQDIAFYVYNIRGQQVRTLMEGNLQPGSYSLSWNGLDDQGRQVASGIYLARLMTGKGYVKTVKMLVLR